MSIPLACSRCISFSNEWVLKDINKLGLFIHFTVLNIDANRVECEKSNLIGLKIFACVIRKLFIVNLKETRFLKTFCSWMI